MFTLQQLNILMDALAMAAKSNLRAMNTRKSPEFTELYTKIDADINEIQVLVRKLIADLPKSVTKSK